MIWVLLGGLVIGLFLASGSDFPRVDAVREGVKTHVADEGRRTKALAALDEAEKAVMETREKEKALQGELVTQLARADATEADLTRALARVDEVEAAAFTKLVAARRGLAGATTSEEWAKLFPALGAPGD